MKIAIAGGNGFIGTELCRYFIEQGAQVYVLTRDPERSQSLSGVTYVRWMHEEDQPQLQLEGVEAIINLAGQSLNSGRWTAARKRQIVESRLSSTKEINRIIQALQQKPQVLLNASAVGYYGISYDRTFTEQDVMTPSDFLSDTVHRWEKEALTSGIRTVLLRLGVVLHSREGAFPRMVLPYKLFAGGTLGSGKQPLSWIHIDDVVRAVVHCIKTPSIQGGVNFTAPEPVTMEQFGQAAARYMRRPHYFPIPSFLMKLVLGEMSTLLLDGQYVMPAKLIDHQYEFAFPTLETALKQLLQQRS